MLDLKVHYLDVPISRGAERATERRLSIMASGSGKAFEAGQPILDSMAEVGFKRGDLAAAGAAMKAVNQLLAGVHIVTMAEAMTFGITQGICPEKFNEVLPKCAGNSWMLENRSPHIVEGDFSPKSALNIWPKDLNIVLEIAESSNFCSPMTIAALKQFNSAVSMGLGEEDDSAVVKVYARHSNLQLEREKRKTN